MTNLPWYMSKYEKEVKKKNKINGQTEKTTRVVFKPHFSQSEVFPFLKQEPLYPILFCRNWHTFSN